MTDSVGPGGEPEEIDSQDSQDSPDSLDATDALTGLDDSPAENGLRGSFQDVEEKLPYGGLTDDTIDLRSPESE